MKRVLVALTVVFMIGFAGCAKQQVASGSEAIEVSKTKQTVDEKVSYLVQQANSFYNSKSFQDAVDVAQYVLANLDKDSQEAKALLEKAKDAILAKAKAAVDTASKDLQNVINAGQ